MAISAKDVMALRKKSGLGMMECKQALEETEGDLTAAEQLLRQRGLAKMDSRAGREATEGRIAAAISSDGSRGAIIEIDCETDFVANNDAFRDSCQKIADLALDAPAGHVDITDQMKSLIDDLRITTKENVQFARGTAIGGDGRKVGKYVHHNGKIGALVEVEGAVSNELLQDLCMHVVAATPTPLGVNDEEVPAEIIEREREIAKSQAMETGKPENIAEKIVEGKIRKFYEDHVLLKQGFVKDDKTRIQDLLPKGASIKGFARYQLGEAHGEGAEAAE